MADSALPIFPLSNVVLFPVCNVALHVFEPRYRQMTAAALKADRMIGMVTVRPEAVREMDGNPPIYPVGCAGFIREHRKLADGRYDLVLRGTHRFRIRREMPAAQGRLYRVAETESLCDPPGSDAARNAALRSAVLEQLQEIALRSGAADLSGLALERLARLDDARFANHVCQALALPADEKQGLLEASDIPGRLARLEGVIAFHLAAGRYQTPGGSPTVH